MTYQYEDLDFLRTTRNSGAPRGASDSDTQSVFGVFGGVGDVIPQLPVLTVGTTGLLVRDWTTFLRDQQIGGPGLVRSVFDAHVKTRTRAYQEREKLDTDGVVGPQTWGRATAQGFALGADTLWALPKPSVKAVVDAVADLVPLGDQAPAAGSDPVASDNAAVNHPNRITAFFADESWTGGPSRGVVGALLAGAAAIAGGIASMMRGGSRGQRARRRRR